LIGKQQNGLECTIDLSWSKLMFDTYRKCDRKFDEKMWSNVLWTSHDQKHLTHTPTTIANLTREKKILTLDVLQRSHNELLNKKLEERSIDAQIENTNSTKHF
jgi:hypothetical protein